MAFTYIFSMAEDGFVGFWSLSILDSHVALGR